MIGRKTFWLELILLTKTVDDLYPAGVLDISSDRRGKRVTISIKRAKRNKRPKERATIT